MRRTIACVAVLSMTAAVTAAETALAAAIAANRAWAERVFAPPPTRAASTSRLTLIHEDGAGDTKLGLCAFGTPMRLGEKAYTRGIGVNSRSVLRVTLDRPAARLLADIGLDRNVDGTAASASMHVAADGKELFATPVLRPDGKVQALDLPLAGATSIELTVNDGGDGRGWDQADWADARVVLQDGSQLWLDDLARSCDAAPRLPFSFVYDGKPSAGFLDTWQRELREETTSAGRRLILTLTDPATKLEVRAACTVYGETPGVDWTLTFTNNGAADTPVLEQAKALDASFALGLGAAPVLHRLKGSTCAADDWQPFDEPLPPGARAQFGAVNGRSSAESPFWNVEWSSGGVIAAVGWSGQWRGAVEHTKDRRLCMSAGMEFLRLKLRPGETIRTPRILLLLYANETPERAYNLFRRTMLAHIVPRIDGNVVVPPIAHLSTAFYELNATSEANVLAHLASLRGLGFEMFWLDAYWTRDGFPAGMGHYGFPLERVEPRDRFPRGLAPIGEAVHAEGLRYLMWFEPERVHPGTLLAKEHPEWVISPGGDGAGLYNLGIPEAREYMTRYLSAAIEAYRLDCLRIDYNIDPLPFWAFLNAKEPDRAGMGEIRYVEGLYRMWDDLLRAHGRLFIDNCASGGRRIDLETCARSIPLWRSDNTCDMVGAAPESILAAAIKNQLMSAGLNRYVPCSVVGQMGASPYLFRSGFNGGIAFAQDCRPADFPRAQLAEAIAEATRVRKYWLGDFYLLSAADLDPAAWCVLQYHRPAEGDGIVVAFRRHRSPYASFECELRAIDPAAEYLVTEAQTYRPSPPVRMHGASLARIKARIDDRPGAVLIEYERAR